MIETSGKTLPQGTIGTHIIEMFVGVLLVAIVGALFGTGHASLGIVGVWVLTACCLGLACSSWARHKEGRREDIWSGWVLVVWCLAAVFFDWATSDGRDVNEAELADTTLLQEALIVDMFTPPVDHQGELMNYMQKLEERSPTAFITMPLEADIADLIKRGIVARTKMAERKSVDENLPPDARVIGNLYLSQKGKELARDIIYLRKHPELNISRPIEPKNH